MAPVEGEVYCTIEKRSAKDFTVHKGKVESLNTFPGVNISVICNPKDGAGMAVMTGQTELVRAIMFDSKRENDPGRDLDADLPLKFSGSKYLILSYAHSTDEVKLQHCNGDPDCPHLKISSQVNIQKPLPQVI